MGDDTAYNPETDVRQARLCESVESAHSDHGHVREERDSTAIDVGSRPPCLLVTLDLRRDLFWDWCASKVF